jgi:O-methyltransferase
MKEFIKSFFRKLGYEIQPFSNYQGKPDPDRPWETDDDFLSIYYQVQSHTLVDRKRLYMLYSIALMSSQLDGDWAEIGVYRGGTALLLSLVKPSNRRIHLFDTFEGMPKTDSKRDIHLKGDLEDTSLHKVRSLLSDFSEVNFHPGFFPETTDGLEGNLFSLVHVDADIYLSVLDSCKFFYPRLVNGGVLIFDDYGFRSCPGAKEAVREFCDSHNTREIYLPTGQALLWKRN